MTMDFINGCLEFFSALLVMWNVRRLILDKLVRGVSLIPVLFFDAWGLWNCAYYPSLGQWWSLTGGLFLVAANVLWTSLAFYYRGVERANIEKRKGQTVDPIRFDAA